MSEFSISDKAKAVAAQLPDLEFPVAPGFYSPPPKLSPTEYCQWCMEMMAGRKDDPAARLAEKCTVEFVL
jgi:hypothetical protein